VDVEPRRDLGFDVAQKGEILLMSMTRLALRQDRARSGAWRSRIPFDGDHGFRWMAIIDSV
jgi:hypothetical protein